MTSPSAPPSSDELRANARAAEHPLIGKTVIWSHGPNRLVGPATHYDSDDRELFIVPDGLLHGHYWVPAFECAEYFPPPLFGDGDGGESA